MRGVRVSAREAAEREKKRVLNERRRKNRGMAMSIISDEWKSILGYSLYVMLWMVLIIAFILARVHNHRLNKINIWWTVLWWDALLIVPSSVIAYDPSIISRAVQSVRETLRYRRELQRVQSGRVV
mmetsp:Transcript_18216/g.45957  ORF Transcript_18216/g.45957 Transcript_18216/m.45957 type:complete len:126 (-) Transcript_18216:342-719(-)